MARMFSAGLFDTHEIRRKRLLEVAIDRQGDGAGRAKRFEVLCKVFAPYAAAMMLEPEAPTVAIFERQHLSPMADIEVDLGYLRMPLFQGNPGRFKPLKHRFIRGFIEYQREVEVTNPNLGLASCDAAIQINPVQPERGLGQGCTDIRQQGLELRLYTTLGDVKDEAIGVNADRQEGFHGMLLFYGQAE